MPTAVLPFAGKGDMTASHKLDDVALFAAQSRANQIDGKLTDTLRNTLFGSFGEDLAARNIYRGRDMRLKSYRDVAECFGVDGDGLVLPPRLPTPSRVPCSHLADPLSPSCMHMCSCAEPAACTPVAIAHAVRALLFRRARPRTPPPARRDVKSSGNPQLRAPRAPAIHRQNGRPAGGSVLTWPWCAGR